MPMSPKHSAILYSFQSIKQLFTVMVIALIRSVYSNDIRTKAITVVATLLSQVRGGDSDAHAHRVPGDIHLVPSCVEDGTDIQRGDQSKACERLHALGRRWRQVEYLEILESVQPEVLRTYPVGRSRRPKNASQPVSQHRLR
jgi:hypothetical protein